MNEDKKIIFRKPVIVKLSDDTIATIDPPNKERSSVKFSFSIGRKKSFTIHDHRERTIISWRIYRENKDLLRKDINRRAELIIKERPDGTRYAILGDRAENDVVIHSFEETETLPSQSPEISIGPNENNRSLIVRKFKEDER